MMFPKSLKATLTKRFLMWAPGLALLVLASGASAALLKVPSGYPTIQAAVDAATAGDEVILAAGMYEEQVVITTDITVTGAGIGQTILVAPAFMPHTVHPLQYNAVIHAEAPASTVVLRDLSIDGAGQARADTRFVGIIYDRAGGTAERIEIKNVHFTPASTATSGIGFYVFSETTDDLDLLVKDVTIQAFQKTGFACFGSGCAPQLENVTVDATALYTDAVQNGFELLNGSSGSLTNCTAIGCWYDGTPIANTTAVGFLCYYAVDWTLENCNSVENQSGIYSIATGLTLSNSSVAGHLQPLNYNYGVVITGPAGAPTVSAPAISLPQALPVTGASTTKTELGTYATMTNCEVRGAKLAGSVGVIAYSNIEEVGLVVENGAIEEWGIGLLADEDIGGWVVGQARTCLCQSNIDAAIVAGTFRPFDARGNYWGVPTGPYHPTANPGGEGDVVGDNVIFDPWLQGNVICAPVALYIAQADADATGYSREVTVRYLGGASNSVYGFSTEVTWDQSKMTATASDVSRPDAGLFQSAVLFYAQSTPAGFRVDGALGGAEAGIAAGDLFKIRFHLVGEPDGVQIPISLTVNNLRDNTNLELTGYVANDGLVIGDVKAPSVSTLNLANTTLSHTDLFAKHGDLLQVDATITDGDPQFGLPHVRGNFIYLFGGPGYLRSPDSVTNDEYRWSETAASLFPEDGPAPYSITASDPAGNTVTVAGSITADNTPPLPVSGLISSTDHNQISLQWDDSSALDTNLRQVVVRSVGTGDYPLYSLPAPAYPATPEDGDPVYTGLGTSTNLAYAADGSERDIVSFQTFVVDQVNLVSPTGPAVQARRTNYLLADVTAGVNVGYDALTDIYDVTRLGDTYDLGGIDPGFNAECDVGPTDDLTSAGLPLPDGLIDIEDLMVFADRFANDLPTAAKPAVTPAISPPDLVWVQLSPTVWSLELATPCAVLKGLHLTGNIVADVSPGQLLLAQAAPYFLHAGTNDLDVSLAVLGHDLGLIGAGELLRIETVLPVAGFAVEVDARSLSNTKLPGQLSAPEAAPLPVRFALRGNHPNPFNPMTTITFDLPSAQLVQLEIYTVDGRRVTREHYGSLPAGVHEIVWRGRDKEDHHVAAGLYLYRLEAGPWSATGKMNLVR